MSTVFLALQTNEETRPIIEAILQDNPGAVVDEQPAMVKINADGRLVVRREGDGLWERFSVKDPADHLWYYQSLLAAFRRRRPDCWMVAELGRVIAAWQDELGRPAKTL